MVNSRNCPTPRWQQGVRPALCTIVLNASKNESKWFLKISQDQTLLQTKPIKNFGLLLGIISWEEKCGPHVQTTKILKKMYIVTCLVHGF